MNDSSNAGLDSSAAVAPDRNDCTTVLNFPECSSQDQPVLPGLKLGRRLGAGAMGTVYLGHRECDGGAVAVKLLREDLRQNREHVQRFLREGNAVHGIHHLSVLPVLTSGIAGDVPFLVTPYHPGGDLEQRVMRDGPLSETALWRLAKECGQALVELHRHGVLHRDLKPANILLAEDGTAVIADFGIACSSLGPALSAGVAGTPNYLSPEQAAGAVLDGRSDLFGLGATLFAAATGRPPFVGPTAYDVVAQVLRDQAPSIRSLRPDLPAPIAAVIDRCLRHHRDQRFPNADALLKALEPSPLPLRSWWLRAWLWLCCLLCRSSQAPEIPTPCSKTWPRPGWRVFYPAPLVHGSSHPPEPDISTVELLAILRARIPAASPAATPPVDPPREWAPPLQYRTPALPPVVPTSCTPLAAALPHRGAARLLRRTARRVRPPRRRLGEPREPRPWKGVPGPPPGPQP